jgi:hypothetical protein
MFVDVLSDHSTNEQLPQTEFANEAFYKDFKDVSKGMIQEYFTRIITNNTRSTISMYLLP